MLCTVIFEDAFYEKMRCYIKVELLNIVSRGGLRQSLWALFSKIRESPIDPGIPMNRLSKLMPHAYRFLLVSKLKLFCRLN